MSKSELIAGMNQVLSKWLLTPESMLQTALSLILGCAVLVIMLMKLFQWGKSGQNSSIIAMFVAFIGGGGMVVMSVVEKIWLQPSVSQMGVWMAEWFPLIFLIIVFWGAVIPLARWCFVSSYAVAALACVGSALCAYLAILLVTTLFEGTGEALKTWHFLTNCWNLLSSLWH